MKIDQQEFSELGSSGIDGTAPVFPALQDAVVTNVEETTEKAQKTLKRSATRGALISLLAQVGNFVLRTSSVMILARLLTPRDFGIVGMAVAATGVLNIIKDAGLGWAMVQRDGVTEAQASTLFWINLGLGATLTALCAALSPAIAAFYGVPALLWINVALGFSFFFNGAAAQHRAMLQRKMRFGAMALIDTGALVSSIVIAIAMALAGQRYWTLVAMTVTQIGLAAVGAWLATQWVPSWPKRTAGVTSMVIFGGTVTLGNVTAYVMSNTDKVLLGRFWGAEALGIYGRAYTLCNVPNENLNSAIAAVAFPALSRLQNTPTRLKDYFLKGYGLFLSLVMPITICCALFSEDITLVMLGPQWHDSAELLRCLAPTILALGLIQPFSWVMLAVGRATRAFSIAVAMTPLAIAGYSIGLHWGALGVAAGFSISMGAAIVPAIAWAKRDTLISARDVLTVVSRPLISIVIAATGILFCRSIFEQIRVTVLRLMVETVLLLSAYLLILIFGMQQKTLYVGLLRELGIWPFSKANATAAGSAL